MRKRAVRLLKELHDKTEKITEPEITPVLEGHCRIQGPVDESDHELHRTNSGIFPSEKNCTFINKSLHMRGESGTCNVCSAPCSSCMHNNRNVLVVESKMECVSSRNSCATNEANRCSFICAHGMPLYKSRVCDDSQHAASEASNLLSDSSSHDSYSDNAESKATVRPSITGEVSEDVDVPPFGALRETDEDHFLLEKRSAMGDCLFSSKSHITSNLGHSTSPKQNANQRGRKCHEDNGSCITGIKDSNIEVGHCNVDPGKNNAACSATADALLYQGDENTVQVEDIVCLHSSENNARHSNYKRPITCTEESFHNCGYAAFPDKSDLAEVHALKHSSPGVQFPCTPSQDGFIFRLNSDCKDLDGSSSCELRIDGESLSGSQLVLSNSFDENKPQSNDEKKPLSNLENSGFSADVVKVTDPCLDIDTGLDKGISSCEFAEPSTIKKEFDMQSFLVEASNSQQLQLQPQQAMESGSSESEVELTDVKVCDICGDAGREELLAFCSRCSDGAEHTYCMRVMLRKVPEGDWLCEECQMKEDAVRNKVERPEKVSGAAKERMSKEDGEVKVDKFQKVSATENDFKLKEYVEVKKGDRSEMVPGTSREYKQQDTESKKVDTSETVPETPKLTSLNGTSQNFASTSNSKLKPRLDMKVVDPDARRVPKGLQSPRISSKRHAESQAIISSNNKKPPEISGECTAMGSPRKKHALSRESLFKNMDTAKASGECIELGSPRKKLAISRESSFKNLDTAKASVECIEMGSRRKKHALLRQCSFKILDTAKASGECIEMGSPRKKPALSRESSFKNLDTGKARVTNMPSPNGGQSANSFKGFSRSQSMLGSHSSKIPVQLQPPSGLLSRSTSLNNLISKPKVKQLTESVPVKRKFSRESSLNTTRKGSLLRSMTKSASLKNFGSGRSNTESVSKTQFICPSQVEGPKSLKQVKERNMIEKKKSSMLDRPFTNLSPRAGTSTTPSKMDMKIAARDVKSNNISESKNLSNVSDSNILRMNRSDDANGLGRNEAKKQSTNSSKILGSASLNANVNEDQRLCPNPKDSALGSSNSTEKLYNNAETVRHRFILQTAESTHRDDKSKDSSIVSSSSQAVSIGNQILHCQRCNETGHTTQFCSVDKLRSSALKSSADKNPKDADKKYSKWKHAVETTISKSRLQKNNRQSDQLEEFTVSVADPSCEVASTVILSSSSNHPRNITPLVETPVGQAISISAEVDTNKTAAHVADMRLQSGPRVEASCTSRDVQTIEASCTPEASNLNANTDVSDELNTKYLLHMFPDQASILANPYRTLAIPELEFIWQGSLVVMKTGSEPTPFDGIQAHLSTSASPKVLEVAAKIPCRVQLEEVPCVGSWPLQSQGISPSEHNIALFFFAKDIESYERSYSKLLENMIKNDLALRGIINDVELLIFPSTRLPVHSQRWNRLFFLWGIFNGRRINSLASKLGSQKKPSEPILNMDPAGQDLPCALSSVVSDSQMAISVENPEKSPRCVISPAAEALTSATFLETSVISSPKYEDKMCSVQDSVVHNSSFWSAYSKLQLEENSSSFPVRHTLNSTSQLSNLLNKHPVSSFDVANTPSCSEVKNDDTYLKKFGYDLEERHVSTASAQGPATAEQIGHGNAPLSYSTSSDCRTGTDRENSRSDKGLGEDISVKNVAATYDDPRRNLPGIGHLIWEERPNRKRARSCYTESLSRASRETTMSTDETMLLKREVNYLPICSPTDDEREHKTMCFSEGHASGSFRQEAVSMRSSSKVYPMLPSFLPTKSTDGDSSKVVIPDDSRRLTEKFFFPVEPSAVQLTKSDNLIHILSSDDEDDQESDTPNLELALGGMWKTQKERQRKGPAEDDDVSPSLSLSLAIPTLKKECSKPILKPEQHLQDRPDVNTALLLFGGITDT